MINILKDIAKGLKNRLMQPSSAASIATIAAYFGISNSLDMSNAITSWIVATIGLYGVIKSDNSETK
jgi:hypothetical protein